MSENKEILCRNANCADGIVDKDCSVPVQVGCESFNNANPCTKCGRLHWEDNTLVFNRSGHKAFFKTGELYNIDDKGKKFSIRTVSV